MTSRTSPRRRTATAANRSVRRPALKHALIERLARYYQLLSYERAGSGSDGRFSSGRIAEALHLDGSQVRRDLASLGVQGQPQLGFAIDTAHAALRKSLGLDHDLPAVLVGAGQLGSALAQYAGLRDFGLAIVGIFDSNPRRIGRPLAGNLILNVKRLTEFVRLKQVPLAILAVPAAAAQAAAEAVIEGGATALWNFAPVGLRVPPKVFVRTEHIAAGLGEISCHIRR